MSEMTLDTVGAQIRAVLQEAFEGPPEGFAYFSNRGDDAGLANLLPQISPAEASQDIGGNSIAAHVHHLCFSLNISAAWLRGERVRPHWPESWSLRTVDDDGWREEQAALQMARKNLCDAIDVYSLRDEMSIGITLGNVAHIACHIGAIRQKLKTIRD